MSGAAQVVVGLPIPGLKPIPLIKGRANLVRFFSDPVARMIELHRDYGLVAALTAGDPSLVCTFGAENNRALLSDSQTFYNFAESPFPVPKGSAPERLLGGLTAMNGDLHKRHRRLLMPALGKSAVLSYAPEMTRVTEKFLRRYRVDQTVDMSVLTSKLALHVAMACLFGMDIGPDAEEIGQLGGLFLEYLTSPWTIALPFRLPGTTYSKFFETADYIDKRIRELIDERRGNSTAGRDVLSIMLHANDEDGTRFTDDDLVAHTSILMIAGHETTANALCYALILLSEHPKILADLEDELESVLRGAAPTPDDLARLPLLDGVVNETMRLLPPTPFLFLRRGMVDFNLGPYSLPAGSMVIASPLVTHRDPELYPDPQAFRPSRWEMAKPGPYEYMPFGAGPRLCLGAAFATQATRLELSMILQRFRPSLKPNTRVDRRIRGLTMSPKRAVPMRLGSKHDPPKGAAGIRGDIRELVDFP